MERDSLMNFHKALTIFGLKENFTSAELKQAYYQKVREYHESNFCNKSQAEKDYAAEKMKEINAARNYLKSELGRLEKYQKVVSVYKEWKGRRENWQENLYLLSTLADQGKTKSENIEDSCLEEVQMKKTNQVNKTLEQLASLLNSTAEKEEDNDIEIEFTESVEPNTVIIKNLISKFLKLFYQKKASDLNFRARNETDKVHGYYYWDKKQIARHLVSKDYSKILNDKYDIEYGFGKRENIPLAIYFDLSGSMRTFITILVKIALACLNKNIKVLIGYNETIYYQINEIDSKTTVDDLKKFFEDFASTKIKYESVYENIDEYLIRKKCERCIIFTDNDSYSEVCNLSKNCEIYLLYCLNYSTRVDSDFQGVYFYIKQEEDLMNALMQMSKLNYRVLKVRNQERARRK